MSIAVAIDRQSVALVLERASTGAWSQPYGGVWVPGAPVASNIRGAIQPAKGTQLTDLPEGIRAEARWLVWSRTALVLDDTIKDGASAYRVMFVWPRREGAFTRAAIGLLK